MSSAGIGKEMWLTVADGTRTRDPKYSFLRFSWRITSLHTIAYTLAGVFAVLVMHYREQFSGAFLSTLMKPVNSPLVALGPALQVVNGFFMSLFLFPIARVLIGDGKTGWRILFLLVAGFSFFTPQVPGMGNFEGLIYTKAPLSVHLLGIPECLIYSLLFSLGFGIWYSRNSRWMNIVAIILVCLVGLMGALGYMDSIGLLPKK
jgi:hypothetical protein